MTTTKTTTNTARDAGQTDVSKLPPAYVGGAYHEVHGQGRMWVVKEMATGHLRAMTDDGARYLTNGFSRSGTTLEYFLGAFVPSRQ